MNSSMIRYLLGSVLKIEGVLLLLPCLVSLCYQERVGLIYLLVAAVCFLTQGGERPGFEKGELLVCVNGGGDVELYWPGTTDPTALYQVEFTCGEARETRYCSQPSLHFSGLPEGA